MDYENKEQVLNDVKKGKLSIRAARSILRQLNKIEKIKNSQKRVA